jgi:Tfp pilus assembly protein PilN
VQGEIGKLKGYDAIKKSLEEDEKTIRAKLDIIRTLTDNRTMSAKILISVASAIPKEVWLSDLTFDGTAISFKGSALGLGQVTDFMKGLTENAFLSDVELKTSQQSRDGSKAAEIATFEITAKRRL